MEIGSILLTTDIKAKKALTKQILDVVVETLEFEEFEEVEIYPHHPNQR